MSMPHTRHKTVRENPGGPLFFGVNSLFYTFYSCALGFLSLIPPSSRSGFFIPSPSPTCCCLILQNSTQMALFQPNSYTSTLSKWSLDDCFPIKDYLVSLSGQTISWEDGKSSIPTKKSLEWFKMANSRDQKSSNLFIHQNLSHGQKSHQVKYIPWSLVMLIYLTL